MIRLNHCFICVCILSSILGKAYSQNSINAGLNLSAGVQGFNENANGKRGLGGSIGYVHNFWKQGGIRASAGFDWFDYRQPENMPDQIWLDNFRQHPLNFQDITFVPVRLGLQQSILADRVCLFADAGIARLKPSRLKARNVFSYSLGAGYRLPFKRDQYMQLSISYNYNSSYKYNKVKVLSDHNYLSFTIAYGLRFKGR
jgi:hypothetical protein